MITPEQEISKPDEHLVEPHPKLAAVEDIKIQRRKSVSTRKKTKQTSKRSLERLLKSPLKRKIKVLKHICGDSGQCLTFGIETDAINDVFKGFTNFRYATKYVGRVGKPSENGFITEIEYKRDEYYSHAILKSALRRHSDNLFYEYIVGKIFINELIRLLPCFVETYGIYVSSDNQSHKDLMHAQTIDQIKKTLHPISEIDDKIDFSCLNSNKLSILIQHIKKPVTFQDLLSERIRQEYFYTVDMIQLLYQIYGPLSKISRGFTHYDLHTMNVLLYSLEPGTYIEMKYHQPDGSIISFNTQYIVKIIDYGKSYFAKSATDSSKQVYDAVCASRKCKPDCGLMLGYQWFNSSLSERNHYISSSLPNISHDLRVLQIIKDYFIIKYDDPKVNNLIDSVVYAGEYGTPPRESVPDSNKIYNVMDAERELKHYMQDVTVFNQRNNQFIADKRSFGVLHIYLDEGAIKPMDFYPA